MGNTGPHAVIRDELERMDYFLEHLARAVERGEVPMASYEALAPRYLARRQEIVGILTPATPTPVLNEAPFVARVYTPRGAGLPAPTVMARATPSARPLPSPREPISWTTVLLFLGAFLVIVASAIFALAVWNKTGVVFRLGFLGGLTVAFYGAGYAVRKKLELRNGGAALTVVGSAMLLFDCWIVISGFHLTGPLPWAAALFLCSAVYWLTEVALGDGFYGIAGAAAQMGWWWLMTAGLGFEVPVRLAGFAVIAVLWQIVAEPAQGSRAFGPLATVLLWSAPVVTGFAAIGTVIDVALVGTTTWTIVGCAAVVSASIAVVLLRGKMVARADARWIAGAGQAALFAAALMPGTSSWASVGLLAAAAVAYALTALFVSGTPFAMASLGMQLLAVQGAMSLLHASEPVYVGALAILAVAWAVTGRLADKLARSSSAAWCAEAAQTARVSEWGSLLLLVGASVLAPLVADGLPLSGVRILSADAILAAVVLVSWAAASLVRRNPLAAFATSLWSLYTLAAVAAWAIPAAHSAIYGLALLALVASWLPARGAMQRFYGIDEEAFGWTMRFLAFAIVIGGLAAEWFYFHDAATWQGVGLAVGAAVLFGVDAEFGGPQPSASIAGGFSVLGAYLAGAVAGGGASGGALAATGMALSLSLVAGAVRGARSRYAGWLAIAACAAATAACFTGADGWALAGAIALVAFAWAGSAFAAREGWFALPAGLLGFAACAAALAAANLPAGFTVIVLSVAGLALGASAFFPRMGPDGGMERVGAALVVAGLAGQFGFIAAAWMTWGANPWAVAVPRWLSIGGHGEAVLLLVLGSYIVLQSVRWKVEAGGYVGWGVILCALFAEFIVMELHAVEYYSTSLAVYLAAMGEIYARRDPARRVAPQIDLAVVVAGLGVPAFAALGGSGADGMIHFGWVVGLSCVAIGVGVAVRVRAYFLGGVAAIVVVVGWKALAYLVQFWWALLGLMGIAMLVIALTWERQRMAIADTRRQFADSLDSWR